MSLLDNYEETPFWSYSHEEFLKSRKERMAESEKHLRKTVKQMFNFLRIYCGRSIQMPGWTS